MNADEKFLNQLSETIEQLRSRIERHGADIGGHETRTRVVLIDPLLRSLGWDTEDPEMVVHEHRAGSLKLDYALVDQGEVIGIVEAKVLGSKLNDAAWGKYVAELPRVPVVAFTNGDEWRFFRKSNKWQPETVRVSSGESFRTGWEFNQKFGRDAVQTQNHEPTEVREHDRSPPETQEAVGTVGVHDGQRAWHSLTEVSPARGKKNKRPTAIKFASGEELAVSSWEKVYEQTGRYVDGRGLVLDEDHPVVLAERLPVRKCAMNTSPVHPHGRDFARRIKIREGLWMEREVGSIERLWKYSIRMLERFGIDASTVKVAFD